MVVCKVKIATLLFESKEIEKRWIEYILKLYKNDMCGEGMKFTEYDGPEITADEVERARERNKKAAGIDCIATGSKSIRWYVIKDLDRTM